MSHFQKPAFYIGLFAIPVVVIFGIRQMQAPATSIGASMAAPLIILCTLAAAGVLWLAVMLITREWLSGILGMAGGILLSLGIGAIYSSLSQAESEWQWQQVRQEEAMERKRLLQVLAAAQQGDQRLITTALQTPSAFNIVESMCALTSTDDTPLDEILQDLPVIGRDGYHRGYRVDSTTLLQVANVIAEGDQPVRLKQAMLFAALQGISNRGDLEKFPAWRELWTKTEQLHGITPQWPPSFVDSIGNGMRGYCDGGDNARLQALITKLSSQLELDATIPAPPAPGPSSNISQ